MWLEWAVDHRMSTQVGSRVAVRGWRRTSSLGPGDSLRGPQSPELVFLLQFK